MRSQKHLLTLALWSGLGLGSLQAKDKLGIQEELSGIQAEDRLGIQEEQLEAHPSTAATAEESMAQTSAMAGTSATNAAPERDGESYERFRIGGYGEMTAAWKDYGYNRFTSSGSQKKPRATISIPRFVLAIDYKFTSKWILGAEIEFESGGAGAATEVDYADENGEYETEQEKGGEVAIEQFHLTRLIHPAFNVRAGHLILPLGLTNAHHEPIFFYGSTRPESETAILPCTWHETGLELFGSIGPFSYQAMVVAGLNAFGFRSQDFIVKGKQGLFEEDNFTSPGYLVRIDWHGLPGLRLGASAYHCGDAGANVEKPSYTAGFSVPVSLLSADARWKSGGLTARANVVYGHIGNTARLYSAVRNLSNKSPYSRSPVGKNALAYGVEAGYNLGRLSSYRRMPQISPFVRYEYSNPQESASSGQLADKRLQIEKWTFGANWNALPNLVVKADYATRRIGRGQYHSENEFSVGLAYIGWFFRK